MNTDLAKNLLHLEFRQTGDPWHDWGLCELYDVLRTRCQWPAGSNVQVSAPDPAGFTVTGSVTPDGFGQALGAALAASDRWNALHPRFEEGKKISRCQPSAPGGRRAPGEKYDPKVSKAEWDAAGCRGNPPATVRNRCQRLASVPIPTGQVADLMKPNGGAKSIMQIAFNTAAGKELPLTQGINPQAGKYQGNSKVRGFSTAGYCSVPAQYVLACACASTSACLPFDYDVKNKDCTVYLPDNLSFARAWELRTQLAGVLVDPDSPSGEMYRNLPLRGDGEEAYLLVLLDAFQSKLALKQESGDWTLPDELIPNNWLAVHFSSGTNVSVGGIHRIEVPSSVFPLLRPIPPPSDWKNPEPVAFVSDCLTGVRVETDLVQSRIAHALFLTNRRDTWHALATIAFSLYKNVDQASKSSRLAAALLPHFFFHFAKELLAMTEEQTNACRDIGRLIGSAFPKDVTLISRLHNAATPEDLRANLNTVGFRLFKASNGTEDEKRALWRISPQQFSTVLDMTAKGGTEWQAAAQTISVFASLTAFNKNLNKEKE